MNNRGSYGDPDLISKLSSYRMPFGKYSTHLLIDLPLAYLNWFSRQGFPTGELGRLMRIVQETKADGLEGFFDRMRNQDSGHLADSADN